MVDESGLDDERRKQIIDIWKTVVGVQQHFNDISMRIRGMFVTILLALFASIGFLLDKKLNLRIYTFNFQFATLMPVFGILGTYLFYFIDRYWYHRLLVGSVKHAINIEKKYRNEPCLSG
jgi:sterol desaturase/sphingolipid hydroxylase (fatty acid hydroxylase superfamily)